MKEGIDERRRGTAHHFSLSCLLSLSLHPSLSHLSISHGHYPNLAFPVSRLGKGNDGREEWHGKECPPVSPFRLY